MPSTNQHESRIVLHNATVRYGNRIALEAVSGEFSPGSLTAIIGANGAGKSTLLAAIAGTVRLAAGTIQRPRTRQMAYMPQRAALELGYPITLAEFIALGAWNTMGAFRAPNTGTLERIIAAAKAVGLEQHLDRRIGALSIGELQRALFARLIVQDAAVILLDEPFAGVDSRTMTVLMQQILQWHHDGRTVIAVLHDLDIVRAHFPSTLVLARRCLAWGTTETALGALAA